MNNFFWGNLMWKLMHLVAYSIPPNLPIEHLHLYHNFYNNIVNVIPCIICKIEYNGLLHSQPITNLKNRDDFIRWVNNIHNTVNSRLGKVYYSLEDSNEVFINKNYFFDMREFLTTFSEIALDFNDLSFYSHYYNLVKLLAIIHPINEIRSFLIKIILNSNNLNINFYRKWCFNLKKNTS